MALLAAVVSFGWMVYQLERYRRKEPVLGTDPVAAASGL